MKTQDELQKIEQEKLKRIKKTLDSPSGEDLKRYFLNQIILFRNVNNVSIRSTASATTADFKAHQALCAMFEKMLVQLMSWTEQELQEQEENNIYGVGV